jgi:hypothetical protein
MIEIQISQNQRDRAQILFDFGILNNSIREGDGKLTGALGEIVVFDYYSSKGRKVIHAQEFNYDLLIEGFKVEIKTMARNGIPKLENNCHLSNHNAKQRCDYFIFVDVLNDYSRAWIKGVISRQRFDEIKVFKKKGEFDGPFFQFKSDTWIITNKDLLTI